MDCYGVINRPNLVRAPSISERKVTLGFFLHYITPCVGKADRKKAGYDDVHLTLLENS